MAINKVIYGGNTLIDLTDTTAVAANVLDGYYFYGRDGVKTEGTCTYNADTSDATALAADILAGSNEFLSSYFKVEFVGGNPVVKIGSSSSDYIMVLEADRLSFQDQYGNIQAYFEGDSFVLQQLDTFKIGNLQIKTQGSPYSLSFVKAV